MTDARVRWRMTFDELCAACDLGPNDLERLAQLGALGPRWRERRDRGKWRHVTREAAQRAVLCARLLHAGMTEQAAVKISATHTVKDAGPLDVQIGELHLTLSRDNLP